MSNQQLKSSLAAISMMTKNKRLLLLNIGLIIAVSFVSSGLSYYYASSSDRIIRHRRSEYEDKKREGLDGEKEKEKIESEGLRAGQKKVMMCAIVKDEEAYIDK